LRRYGNDRVSHARRGQGKAWSVGGVLFARRGRADLRLEIRPGGWFPTQERTQKDGPVWRDHPETARRGTPMLPRGYVSGGRRSIPRENAPLEPSFEQRRCHQIINPGMGNGGSSGCFQILEGGTEKLACGGPRTSVFCTHFVPFLIWPPDAEHLHARRCVHGRFPARLVRIAPTRARVRESEFDRYRIKDSIQARWDRRIGIASHELNGPRAESDNLQEVSRR
jgi:hypothetical protein